MIQVHVHNILCLLCMREREKIFNQTNYFRTTHSAIQEENNDAFRAERGRELNAAKLYCIVNNDLDQVHIYSGTYLRS